MRTAENAWPLEISMKVQQLIINGMTAEQISHEVPKSRSAILGWAWRKKITLPRVKKPFTENVQVKVAITQPVIIKNEPVSQQEPLKAFQTCQWLFGEARNRHFCTNKATHGSWCEGHHRQVYVVKG